MVSLRPRRQSLSGPIQIGAIRAVRPTLGELGENLPALSDPRRSCRGDERDPGRGWPAASSTPGRAERSSSDPRVVCRWSIVGEGRSYSGRTFSSAQAGRAKLPLSRVVRCFRLGRSLALPADSRVDLVPFPKKRTESVNHRPVRPHFAPLIH